MHLTYTLPAESLDNDFLENIKAIFGRKEINITVEDAIIAHPDDQIALFDQMEMLREKLKGLKVNPNLDLSRLADEGNL